MNGEFSPSRGGGFAAQQRSLTIRLLLFGLGTLFLSVSVQAQSLSAAEIIHRSQQRIRGRTEQGEVTMTVRTPDWQRTLQMNYWAINPDKTFIRVTAPAKEAGTATLRLGSNMWNYLPSVERVIKIPPSLMLQSWLGSDFTNDDVVRESSLEKDYDHKFDGEAVESGDACYRIVSTPKPDAPVVWGHLIVVIRKKDDLPRREEYYDDRGKLQKILTFEDIRVTHGRMYPMLWKMVSVTKPGHETVLVYRDLRFDEGIGASVFTRDNLQQPF